MKSPKWQAKKMMLGLERMEGFKQANDLFGFYFYKAHSGCFMGNIGEGDKTGSWEI